MALGVLNNLSAIYAENNLNNTSNSLQNVLRQLSSGSRINSGADDSAGLSLVNGLQANSMALKQSATNATEGVGLLQVADGALSQVTNLLNRAITLATEASNGTLNASQGSAANQEYQSILAEINNIGSTTTYNQQAVFGGKTVSIYTGDASPTGSSIDNLYIRTLSAASVGDTGGAMSYSNGQDNVFINLSRGGINASVSDSLNGGGTGSTTIAVNYLAKGTNGTSAHATANINVGAGSNYANTAQGLIDAINNSGLGLSATFSTAAQAGSAAVNAARAANALGGGDSDTGIEISGTGVGTGTNGAGEIGTLTLAQTSDILAGALTIVGADGKSHNVVLGSPNSTDTLAHLAATINAAGYGVVASTNSAIVDGNAVGTILTFSSDTAAVTVSGTSLTETAGTAVSSQFVSTNQIAGSKGTIGTIAIDNRFDSLSGTLTLTGSDGTLLPAINLGTANATDTLANLANYINTNTIAVPAASNIVATLDSTGTMLTISTTANTAVGKTATSASTVTAAHTTQTAALTGTPIGENAGYNATIGTLTAGNPTGTLSGTLTIGANTPLTLGGAGLDTMANLAATINSGNLGVTATLNSVAAGSHAAGTVMTFTSSNSAESFTLTSTTGVVGLGGETGGGSLFATTAVADPDQIGTLKLGGGGAAGDILTAGKIVTFGNVSVTIIAGVNDTLATLKTYINNANIGVNASLNGGTMTFTSTNPATQGVLLTNNLADSMNGAATYTSVTDTPSTANSGYYSIGITGSLFDSSTLGGTLNTGMVVDTNGTGSIATMSYTDGAGANLSSSDLTTQVHAQAAMTALNEAIADVAAMDGYIGAQINTLNSLSQVLHTQMENVVSAQNAIQATDYASATSDMSKYEILSQTGIAALAQANTVQQEVTKLLQ